MIWCRGLIINGSFVQSNPLPLSKARLCWDYHDNKMKTSHPKKVVGLERQGFQKITPIFTGEDFKYDFPVILRLVFSYTLA